jgi:hypothetical protein
MPPVGATSSLPPPTDRIDTTSLDPRFIEDDLPLKPSAAVFPEDARAFEGHVLESKVARVASKECSVEEVTALLKEVDQWLMEVTAADEVRVTSSSSNPSLTLSHSQSTALFLSSMFLKTILANHDASASLTSKVDEVELEKGRLEAEVHKQKVEYSQKVRECQGLRTELSRVTSPAASMASPAESAHAGLSSSSRPSASPPSSSVTSPTLLPHPTPSAYYNRRHEKEKEKLRELTRNNSSGSTGRVSLSRIRALQEKLVPESDDEAERTRSNRRWLLNAILADAPIPQSTPAPILAAPPPPPPPPPPSRPPTVISRASTAAAEMERERERRRRQSNENRGRETPIVDVPPPPPPSQIYVPRRVCTRPRTVWSAGLRTLSGVL